ncbi:MAG: ABC transporter permease [Phycisphaerae bacterium]|nr:ABC transporter permease [Phycisphaerae bacterium]
MTRRLRRAWNSRAWRKFRRNRLAMVALGVIACYAAIGLWVLGTDAAKRLGERTGWWSVPASPLLDALTVERADEVVGAPEIPGFGIRPRPEERVRIAQSYLDEFRKRVNIRVRNRAEADQRAADAIAGIRFAEATPPNWPIAEFRERIKAALDDLDAIAEVGEVDRHPELLPRIEKVERDIASMLVAPAGVRGMLYHARLALGTDRQGRSILVRAVYSIKVAIQIGLVVALVAVLFGSVLGAAAAFFGGWVDLAVVWLYSTLSSLPDLVLLGVLVFMFTGSIFDDVTKPWLSLVPIYAAMCLTFWIGPCRVVRGEVMKIKELEYIQAARAIGFGRAYILIRHALPNTLHLMFINFSLLFIAAIKNEVVLSFLGLGVKVGPSWGRMIQESTPQVINGFYWQIGAATVFMFFLVLAFNIVSDALQDAFDPKHVS